MNRPLPTTGECGTEAIRLRRATLEDWPLLLDWRNDRTTREASHQASLVQPDEHIAWLTDILNDQARELYLAEEGGQVVGTVRAELTDGIYELSWSVAPMARGRGVATRMVALLTAQISAPIRAEIKAGNLASERVAERAGMTFLQRVGDVLHYRRGAVP